MIITLLTLTMQRCDIFNGHETTSDYRLYSILEEPFSLKKEVKSNKKRQKRLVRKKQKQINITFIQFNRYIFIYNI